MSSPKASSEGITSPVSWQINNTTGLDLVVLSPTPATASTMDHPVLLSNQELISLTSTDGKTTIPPGTKMSYSSNEDNPAKDLLVHELYVCRTDNLFPVAVFSLPVNGEVQELTVSGADQRLMELGAKFQQTISVYPNSKLAREFFAVVQTVGDDLTAIIAGTGEGKSRKLMDRVDAFFKTTKGYKDLSATVLTVVQDYYHRYPMIWVTEAAYPIYSVDDSVAPMTRTLIGNVAFVKPDQLVPEKPNAGYQCDFTSVSGKKQSLTFANGLFVDNPQAEKPAIGLAAAFVQEKLSQSGKRPAQVTTVVVGRVNGDNCLGIAQRGANHTAQAYADSPKDGASSDWDSFFHSYKSVLAILGALSFLMSLIGFGRMVQVWLRERNANNRPVTNQEVAVEVNGLRTDMLREVGRARLAAVGNTNDIKNVADAIRMLAEGQRRILDRLNGDLLEQRIADLAGSVEELSEQMAVMDKNQIKVLESQASKLFEIKGQLDEAKIGELSELAKAGMELTGNIAEEVGKLSSDLESKLSETVKEAIDEYLESSEFIVTEYEYIEETEAAEALSDDPTTETIEEF